MINLLPPETKQSYRYGRSNYRLVIWSTSFAAAIVGVVVITAIGLSRMHDMSSMYQARIDDGTAQLERQQVASVQKQLTTTSSNLKLMVQVLSKQILFSKLLARLGSATPSDTVLTNLSISQTERAIDITAQARTYEAATQLQVNLADPANQIFSKADIVNISCATENGQAGNDRYPCSITIRALFTDNNPFLFINNANQTKGSTP